MGHFPLRKAVILAVYLVTFEGGLTQADERQPAFSSNDSGDSNNPVTSRATASKPLGDRNFGEAALDPSDCVACMGRSDCSWTFDAQAKPHFGGLRVTDVPSLRQLTMCEWTKFPQTSVTVATTSYLLRYEAGDKSIDLKYEHQATTPPSGSLRFQVNWKYGGVGTTIPGAFLDDHQWHHICVTWSGTGVTEVYVDNKRVSYCQNCAASHGGSVSESLPSGGILTVLHSESLGYYITEVNLWNRALSYNEITQSSQSCHGSTGNVKKWMNFWPFGNTNAPAYTFLVPSQCRSPAQTSADVAADNEDRAEDQSVGKKNHLWKALEK